MADETAKFERTISKIDKSLLTLNDEMHRKLMQIELAIIRLQNATKEANVNFEAGMNILLTFAFVGLIQSLVRCQGYKRIWG
jgi:Na+/pantothenate symporter